jgi:hypothetical protein
MGGDNRITWPAAYRFTGKSSATQPSMNPNDPSQYSGVGLLGSSGLSERSFSHAPISVSTGNACNCKNKSRESCEYPFTQHSVRSSLLFLLRPDNSPNT